MKNLVCVLGCLCLLCCGASSDLRPPLPPLGSYAKSVWCQVNPWFPFDKQPIHDLGGPNLPWRHAEGKNLWGQGMLLCESYGVDGWVVEINEPSAWIGVYRDMLVQAKAVKTGVRLALMFGCCSKTPEDTLKAMVRILSPYKDDLKHHPNVARIGGRPVCFIYTPLKYQPLEWKMIFTGLEQALGPMVFLANYRDFDLNKAGLEANLRTYMPCFDGVSCYGSSGLKNQQYCASVLHRVMRGEFPQKLYEGGVHSTYTCHYHMGGLEVPLSRNYRKSFDVYLESGAQSLFITNLFDHYENSLVFPCYEREDFMLRYLQYRVCKWRGVEFPAEDSPELVVTSPCMALLGPQNLEFEILGFPLKGADKRVSVQLELCDTGGEVLRSLPPKTLVLDDFREVQVTLPVTDFAGQRGVIPRLVYTWKGKRQVLDNSPMTLISPSIRSYRMYWARSTKNQLRTRGSKTWSLNGKRPGQTAMHERDGVGWFRSTLSGTYGDLPVNGYRRQTIRRDGVPFYTTKDVRHHWSMSQSLPLPHTGKALHWYHLEMENELGRRVQTHPVWESDGSRARHIDLPVLMADGSIRTYAIEEARVPFFHYPCQRDMGTLLLDVSGYLHNGSINGSGYGGGHLGYMGYHYYHNGPLGPGKDGRKSHYGQDGDGRGFLRCSGKDYVTIMGGTAFPLAATFELSVRPAELGRLMGLLGSGNNQCNVNLLPDGRIEASRTSEKEGMGGAKPQGRISRKVVSKDRLKAGKWTHVAVTYDLKHLRLYLDGRLQGEAAIAPMLGHEWINHLIVGARCGWVWKPLDHFKGDIRDIRFTGRNLPPEEFLGTASGPFQALRNPYDRPVKQEMLFQQGRNRLEEGIQEKDGAFWLKSNQPLISQQNFTVDPEATYEISCQVATRGASFSLYSGFLTEGVATYQVHYVAETDTVLVEDVAPEATRLVVQDGKGWKTGGYLVAFQTDSTGMYRDLPNRNLSPYGIKAVTQERKGRWIIELERPCGMTAHKGEWIREHRYGATYNFIDSSWVTKEKPVTVTARAKGVALTIPEEGKFWPGTKRVKLILCPVGKLTPKDGVRVENLELRKLTTVKP